MADPASTAQREDTRRPGAIVGIVTLPFRIFGALCGSLLLSILIEWLGMHFFWPTASWHHAQHMLHFELRQISRNFPQSLLLPDPGQTARHLISEFHGALFHDPKLAAWEARTSIHRLARLPHVNTLRYSFSVAQAHLKPYLLAALYTVLTCLARIIVLTLTLPLFFLAAFVGLIDGLVRRDLRRFGTGHESGFLYHRARAAMAPATILPCVLYLAFPMSISPLLVLLPGAMLLSLAVNLTATHFKKYL